MTRMLKRRSRKAGMAPGTLVHIGQQKVENVSIQVTDYDAENLVFTDNATVAQAVEAQRSLAMTWVNVQGIHDIALLEQLGEGFGIHRLVLEDILNTDQRPKVDDYGDYLYIVARLYASPPAGGALTSDQVSIILGPDFVLTFQERPLGAFNALRERLRGNRNQVLRLGADYLAYSLLDTLVDRYFALVEEFSDRAEDVEEVILDKLRPGLIQDIHWIKRQVTALRRSIWPLREVLNTLQRSHGDFFRPETQLYLRDVYDHTVHLLESLEDLRDLLTGLLDIYLSTVSNRMNREIRALTVVATVFMPAGLIAGIFGMNFHHMPWLDEPHGFALSLALMGTIASVMLGIFLRRRFTS